MLKQKLVTTTVAAVLAFGVAQVQAANMLQKIGKGEGRVDIVAWPGYIERGETDPNFDWVTSFEKKTGCMVNIKTANTSDEMVALMNEGGFDLVTASGDASLRLVAGKRVQPVNVETGAELEQRRQALAKRPLAYGERRALRRSLHVGTERVDVRYACLQGSAEELERGFRRNHAR